jgi:hypothetical protein
VKKKSPTSASPPSTSSTTKTSIAAFRSLNADVVVAVAVLSEGAEPLEDAEAAAAASGEVAVAEDVAAVALGG